MAATHERSRDRDREALRVDRDWSVQGQGAERDARGGTEVERQATTIEDDARSRNRRSGVDFEDTGIDGDARAGGGRAGERERTRVHNRRTGVGIRTREDEFTSAELDEVSRTRDDTREVDGRTRAEVRNIHARVSVEVNVRGEGVGLAERRDEATAEARNRVHVEGGIIRRRRGGRTELHADTDTRTVGRTEAAAAIHDAEVDAVPTRGRSGEGRGGEVGVNRRINERRAVDD